MPNIATLTIQILIVLCLTTYRQYVSHLRLESNFKQGRSKTNCSRERMFHNVNETF